MNLREIGDRLNLVNFRFQPLRGIISHSLPTHASFFPNACQSGWLYYANL